MDVVDKIKRMPTGAAGPFASDVPKTPVIITSATLVNSKVHADRSRRCHQPIKEPP